MLNKQLKNYPNSWKKRHYLYIMKKVIDDTINWIIIGLVLLLGDYLIGSTAFEMIIIQKTTNSLLNILYFTFCLVLLRLIFSSIWFFMKYLYFQYLKFKQWVRI